MVEWTKICCAVDLGRPSRDAMEQAADLAKRLGAELTLVYVRVPPPPAASDVLISSRTLVNVEAEQDEEALVQWRADAERRSGRPVRSMVHWGDPAAEIVRHARDAGSDLLVVGTHGRTGLPRVVLGSVAERVVRLAPCPVLVIHDHAMAHKAALAEELGQYR